MNTASLELCKELFELSGWDGTAYEHELLNGKHYTRTLPVKEMTHFDQNTYIPAYDLGYLLRKLPPSIQRADTPEDAASKLAIELFKQKRVIPTSTPQS